MSSVGQLQAETIGRPGLLGLWILGKNTRGSRDSDDEIGSSNR